MNLKNKQFMVDSRQLQKAFSNIFMNEKKSLIL